MQILWSVIKICVLSALVLDLGAILINLALHSFTYHPSNSSLHSQKGPPYHISFTFDITNCFLETINNNHVTLDHPDLYKSTKQIISQNNYHVTSYNVTSSAGYITNIERVSGGPSNPPKKGKPSILLVHGLGASSRSWFVQDGNRNLPFKLVDEGYDVWLPSTKGSTESLNHTFLDSRNDIQFWNFTIDDLASEDLPLVIELMLKETRSDQINYICHSLGCTMYLMALSEMPHLNSKIKKGILLGPGAYFDYMHSIVIPVVDYIPAYQLEPLLFKMFGGRVDKLPNDIFVQAGLTTENFCRSPILRCGLCVNFMSLLHGFDGPQLNYTSLPIILDKLSDNIPLQLPFQILQMRFASKFQKYDYGLTTNTFKYGGPTPPVYNLSQVTSPTFIFYGEMDIMTTSWDTYRLVDNLPSNTVRALYKVPWPFFNHIDFLSAQHADQLVYNKIIQILNKKY